VARQGYASLYCGRTFKCSAKLSEKHNIAPFGKIVAVVQKAIKVTKDDQLLYFKYYNHVEHRSIPPSNSDKWKYVKCNEFMKTNPIITLDAKNGTTGLTGHALQNRKVHNRFADFDDNCKSPTWGFYNGNIDSFDGEYYNVTYEDNDFEQYTEKEILDILKP
jgi:hypothetical protein